MVAEQSGNIRRGSRFPCRYRPMDLQRSMGPRKTDSRSLVSLGLLVRSPLLHPIHHAEGLAVAEELAFGTVEEVAYFNIGAFILRVGCLENLFQSGGDVLECHPLTTVGISLWGARGFLEE